MTGTVIIVKVNPRLIPLELNNLYLQTQTCMKTYQNHSQTNLLNLLNPIPLDTWENPINFLDLHQSKEFNPKLALLDSQNSS